MKLPRASGILLHPTSLPNDFGIGDFGKSAFEFVDFLESAQLHYWQVLPLGPTGFGDSPYQSFSAFAGNTNLISPEKLIEKDLLDADDAATNKPGFDSGKIEYGKVIAWKTDLLKQAFLRFKQSANPVQKSKFKIFEESSAFWLEDYSLFRAIKVTQGEKQWLEWDEPLRLRNEDAIGVARNELTDEIEAEKFYQFLFYEQWRGLKNYANDKGVRIIGDIPIFVSMDSSDVWCNRDEFKLKEDGSPEFVAGVPPDFFSKTGQLWGNPIYDWDKMRTNGFCWWKDRIRSTLSLFDLARVDHFRGFSAAWEVPGDEETAENGKWVDVPGRELFEAFRREFATLPLIAEDLGVITDDVEALLAEFGFPGMRILQFGFGGDANSRDLPHNFPRNTVAYSGTHDNDTTASWFNSAAEDNPNRDPEEIKREREFCRRYLRSDGEEIHWDFVGALWASVADTVVVPVQDLLGLGNEARMNLPATLDGNWNWRLTREQFEMLDSSRLKLLNETYGRVVADE